MAADTASRPSMGALVWADLNRETRPLPSAPPTRPLPTGPQPIAALDSGGSVEPPIRIGKEFAEKGTPHA